MTWNQDRIDVEIGGEVEEGHGDHPCARFAPGIADTLWCRGDNAMFLPLFADEAEFVETAEECYGSCIHGSDPPDCCREKPWSPRL